MSLAGRVVRAPLDALEFANILLTQEDAAIGATPKDVVWTHRKVTLYRYRSTQRRHPVPVLLVFALINRPDIFDLRPGHSFVEFLLAEGFDVYLLDWGHPGEEDADMGLEAYVCDELHWGIRETLRGSGARGVTLAGWCIGAALCAMYAALEPAAVRNLVLLTAPIDVSDSLYARWLREDVIDVERVTDGWPTIPGRGVDVANKTMKPVTNWWTTYRRLWDQVVSGGADREAYQAMAKWVADNPDFPGRAYREWVAWMYQENRLVRARIELRGRRVDLRRITQPLLVVTAGSDHITPPTNTSPLLGLVSSDDVTHLARPGGHIGLMAGSRARKAIWPDLAGWLAERSAD